MGRTVVVIDDLVRRGFIEYLWQAFGSAGD
jgi:hypothetical protein